MPLTINPADVFVAIGRKPRGIFMYNVSDIESLAVVNRLLMRGLRSLRSLRPLPTSSSSSLRDNLLPSGPSPCPCPGVDTPLISNLFTTAKETFLKVFEEDEEGRDYEEQGERAGVRPPSASTVALSTTVPMTSTIAKSVSRLILNPAAYMNSKFQVLCTFPHCLKFVPC